MNRISAETGDRTGISVSVVIYHPEPGLLDLTFSSLLAALDACTSDRAELLELIVVNNGGGEFIEPELASFARPNLTTRFITGHGNVGYGRGHNLAIAQSHSRFHLILNPDIDLDREALANAVRFLDTNPQVGLLTPWIGGEDGRQQFLCRRFPAVFDLFARGFLPASVRRFFARRLARYEMRDVIDETNVLWDPPIVSGCFMLFRTDVLKRLNGFDPRYFLYFEDYDLSLRTHEVARVAYVPSVRVLHHGGGAAKKGSTHVKLFAASAFKFFNRFGWKWL